MAPNVWQCFRSSVDARRPEPKTYSRSKALPVVFRRWTARQRLSLQTPVRLAPPVRSPAHSIATL
eukprot:14563766-Alexandrium_andersonii.AAC.1